MAFISGRRGPKHLGFERKRRNPITLGTHLAQSGSHRRAGESAEEETRRLVDLRDQYVRFKISDVYMPDPLILLYQLHGSDQLQGRVIDMSDSGTQKEAFAVIEVEGIDQLIVVPVKNIEGVA
jgi:hypothetical protein